MISRIKVSGVILLIVLIQSCKKETDNSITDSDGNVYNNTVTIGTQVWMTENLKTAKYSNGDSIGTTTLDISNESAPKYQWAYNADERMVATYGRLYTWYAVTDSRNICPTGWHVPTDEDWTTLTTFLGGEEIAGGKLKETGTAHWLIPNAEATNETHFTALPGGYRYITGTFGYLGNKGFWWSSTEHSAPLGYFRTISSIFGFVNGDGTNKQYGFSVRCIKDK
jgi:uncharacterized protein (TIGR02145 family)